MLAGGGIGPFAGGAGAGFGSGEADIEAAAGRVVDIARQPVAAVASAVGKIMAAHGLGMARERLRQFGGLTGHERLLMPRRDQRCGPAGGAP